MEKPNYILKANESVRVPKNENSNLGWIGTLFGGGTKKVSSPFEIRFYDEYLVVYREKRYYSKSVSRKEYDKFFYKDIKKCQYRTVTKRMNIYGIVEGTWFNYKKDGTLPTNPTYHKTVDSICYFYPSEENRVDFVREIESHSPIRVVVENN